MESGGGDKMLGAGSISCRILKNNYAKFRPRRLTGLGVSKKYTEKEREGDSTFYV